MNQTVIASRAPPGEQFDPGRDTAAAPKSMRAAGLE